MITVNVYKYLFPSSQRQNRTPKLWNFWIKYFGIVFTEVLLSVNDFTLSSFSINGTIWWNNWQLLNIRSRSCEYYIYTEFENLNVNQAHLINVWTTYLILNLALIGDTLNVFMFLFSEKMVSRNQENMSKSQQFSRLIELNKSGLS